MSVRMIISTVVCPARAVHPLSTVSYCVQKPTAITDAQDASLTPVPVVARSLVGAMFMKQAGGRFGNNGGRGGGRGRSGAAGGCW